MKKLIGLLLLICVIIQNAEVNGQGSWTYFPGDSTILNFKGVVYQTNLLGVIENVNGAIWFITPKGIFTYNNEKWNFFNGYNHLISSDIYSYLLDSKNRIWIGSSNPELTFDGYGVVRGITGGVSIYDIENDSWEKHNKNDLGIKAPNVNFFYETKNGDVWFAMSPSIKGAYSQYGNLWPGGLIQYNNEKFIEHRKELPKQSNKFVERMLQDNNGRLWFNTPGGEIFYFENNKFSRPDINFFENGFTKEFHYSKSKELMFFGGKKSVVIWNGEVWKTYYKKNSVFNNDQVIKFFDFPDEKVGLIGLKQFYIYDDGPDWIAFEYDSKPKFTSRKFFDVDNKEKQIFYIEPTIFIFVNNSLQEINKKIKKLAYNERKDILWVITKNGIEYLENNRWQIVKDIKKAWDIEFDSHGGTWVLTHNHGIYYFKDNKWIHYNEKNDLPSDKIKMLYEDSNGVIWIGTKDRPCKFEYDN